MGRKRASYAIEISERNVPAIVSEAGPHLTRQMVLGWLEVYDEGYFVRDPGSPWDCDMFEESVFHDFFRFRYSDDSVLFREIIAKK